ncbi:MAG: N-acetylmuramoyl-L-alanine amidase CwlD [Clostridium sp.]
MKKLIALIIPLLLFTGINAYATTEKIVLIDAGHGGYDGGAKSKAGTIEKDINLQISLILKEKLTHDGYTVYMTRENDTALSNKKKEDLDLRCKMKKDTMCHVFISVHQNKFPQTNCFGAQVWYADNEKSSKLANFIQAGLKENINDNNKRVAKCAKKDYRILRDGYDGASVIVECGFISNPNEEQKLKTLEHQEKIASGILEGVKVYFQE